MSLPVIEVAAAPFTDAYRADPTGVLAGAADILKNSSGFVKVYHGLQVEDPNTGYLFVIWETLEHHRKLQADPVVYPLLHKELLNAVAGRPELVHIQPTSLPGASAALEAPATELAYATPKPGQSKDALHELLVALDAHVHGLPKSFGFLGGALGTVVEKPDTFALVAGWTSVETHAALAKDDKETLELLTKIGAIADISLTHAVLH